MLGGGRKRGLIDALLAALEAAHWKAYDTLIALPVRVLDALLVDKGYEADAIRADPASRAASRQSFRGAQTAA